MPINKEIEKFTDSEGSEYEYHVFTLTLRNADLSTYKYVLVNKYGAPIITITYRPTDWYRIGMDERGSYTADTYRVIVEFQKFILDKEYS